MRPLAVVVALFLAPLALAQPGGSLPPGCSEEGDGFLCEWDFDTTVEGSETIAPNSFSAEVPVRGRMLATVTVRLEGPDLGWTTTMVRFLNVSGEGALQASRSSHNAQPGAASFHTATSIFVVEQPAFVDGAHYLGLVTGYAEADEFAFTSATYAPGRYHIVYATESLPPGEVPSRPAATQQDPHADDLARDARRAEYDILAAWLDDARVDDRLFDAHLQVADLSAVQLPTTPNGQQGYVLWTIPLEVGDDHYEMRWFAGPGDSGVELECNFRRAEGQALPIVGFPSCTFDRANGTMHAVIPEGFLGAPGDGVPIRLGPPATFTSSGLVDTALEDEASNVRYDFALGGPAVWSSLNPRLDPPATVAAAWYQDPLARENIPDSLSVLAAFLAGITFLVGFVALRRNRRHTRMLLARVDALVEAHERDARAALRELGRLEAEFARLYRAGSINETQYQVATQRVVAAASRMALRRELGLDDGTPDEKTSVRIDVHRSP